MNGLRRFDLHRRGGDGAQRVSIWVFLGGVLLCGVGLSAAPPNPADFVYGLYRTDYDGFGDDGTACPVATCKQGTVFVAFSNRKGLDVAVAAMSERSRTGPLPLWGVEASGSWIAGHQPKLVCYPVKVPVVPIFVDKLAVGTLESWRIELHEIGYNPVRIFAEPAPLRTGQTDRMRIDAPYGRHTNHGDSSTPRFVRLPDGRLALLGQEITLLGTASNWPVILEMLERAKALHAPDLSWSRVWLESSADGPVIKESDGSEPAPVPVPAPQPPRQEHTPSLEDRISDLERKSALMDLRLREIEKR